MQTFSLLEFANLVNDITNDAIAADVEKVKALKIPHKDTTDEDLPMASRLYLAMRAIIAAENLDALTIREWPELPNTFGQWPYLGVARLADEGVEKFGDFELEYEMNPDWHIDTGVFFRCTDAGDGFQMYVDYHEAGNVGHLRGEMEPAFAIKPFQIFAKLDGSGRPQSFSTGEDPRAKKWPPKVYEYTCTAEEWLKAWRVGEWNKGRVRCVGKYPQITTWVNDLKVCHFNGDTCPLPEYDKEKVFGILGREGSIGLQVHGGKGWASGAKCRWRNLRIKRL